MHSAQAVHEVYYAIRNAESVNRIIDDQDVLGVSNCQDQAIIGKVTLIFHRWYGFYVK